MGIGRPSKGGYLADEACAYDPLLLDIYNQLGRHLKSRKPLPILISPLMLKDVGTTPDDPEYEELTRLGCLHWHDLAGYEKYWDMAFKGFDEVVDIVAFQDGYVPFLDLPDYLEIDKRLADKFGVTCWSNVESFKRNTPINFLPIDWRGSVPIMVWKAERHPLQWL